MFVCVCVCVCVQGVGFLSPCFKQILLIHEASTFDQLEALCFHGKCGVWGGLESHPGEGSFKEPWLHACMRKQAPPLASRGLGFLMLPWASGSSV